MPAQDDEGFNSCEEGTTAQSGSGATGSTGGGSVPVLVESTTTKALRDKMSKRDRKLPKDGENCRNQ